MQHHRRLRPYQLLLPLLLVLSLAACPSEPSEPISSASLAWDASVAAEGWNAAGASFTYRSYEPSRDEDVEFSVSGLETASKAWLVITNSDEGESFPLSGGLANVARSATPSRSATTARGARPRILKDIPAVSAFNADPPPRVRSVSRSAYMPAPQTPKTLVLGTDARDFTWVVQASGSQTVKKPATLRGIVSDGSIEARIWVADESWVGGANAEDITLTMVDAIRDKFLIAGEDNDIYDWVTGVFGDEFTDHGWENVIADGNTIDILLADIYEQNAPNGGVLGYFHSLHNFVKDPDDLVLKDSNESIMFFIDAPMFANPGADFVWSASDSWPEEVFSTLAHELQHMIHFNQKALVNNVGYSPTWFDEMCSAAAEDIVSYELGVEGPRGVPASTASAGTAPIADGRLPVFAYVPEDSLSIWESDDTDYSVAYAFAAWLGRSYGIDTFADLVKGSLTGFPAVLALTGYSDQGALLRDWAIATLSSNQTAENLPWDYNRGSWFPVTAPGVGTRRLGSINLDYYAWPYEDVGTGLYVWENVPDWYFDQVAPASNTYVALPVVSAASGTVRLYEGMSMTVVVER